MVCPYGSRNIRIISFLVEAAPAQQFLTRLGR
jgi:hypothetical protein